MASKFGLNRYNWLGQKLLAQHQFNGIVRLHQYLGLANGQPTAAEESGYGATRQEENAQRPTSEHLNYLHGLALMKTSTRLDEIIFTLQRLNFDKDSQYFLLLCQCLLYLGNYDSVVALCKQMINKELDSSNNVESSTTSICDRSEDGDLVASELAGQNEEEGLAKKAPNSKKPLETMCRQESTDEFKKVLANINKNHLINDPRLWFTFGLALEFQRQFKDAYLAFRVASRLATGKSGDQHKKGQKSSLVLEQAASEQVAMNNYHLPHIKYAEFCIRYRRDFKLAAQVLTEASQMFPQNYTVSPMLALLATLQPLAGLAQYNKAIEMLSSLEAQSASNRNPSAGYNDLVSKWEQKRLALLGSASGHLFLDQLSSSLNETGDENRFKLQYLLIKTHILINSVLQNSDQISSIFRTNSSLQAHEDLGAISKQLDRHVEALRNSEPNCWASASMWNNLGLGFLMKRRFIACLSCLMKAQHLEPLDWRINYNLALACLHVGQVTKALVCLLASRNLLQAQSTKNERNNLMISTLLAICYDKLNQPNASRRMHIEATRLQQPRGHLSSSVPIISLINYLVFLDNRCKPDDEQQARLKLHLLDQLEQSWLQRNQNDSQFNVFLLEVANEIGERTFVTQNTTKSKKTYAWTKITH